MNTQRIAICAVLFSFMLSACEQNDSASTTQSKQDSTQNSAQSEYSAAEHSTTEHPATEHSTTEHPATEHSATEHSATEHSATEHSTTEHPATEHSATEHSATEHPATEHPATEHSAAEHSTTEHPATEPSATVPSATVPSAAMPSTTEKKSTEVPPLPAGHAPVSVAALASAQKNAFSNTLSGEVLETFDASTFTYVQVKTGNGPIWAAGPVTTIKKGDTVSFGGQTPMENFHSASLNRTFKIIYFANSFGVNQ